MPFTLAHPAAIAPFRRLIGRGRLPFAAFVIGTMSPDFEYLFRLEPIALLSHASYGLFLYDVPVGLGAVVLWEFLLRNPTRALLALPPEPLEERRTPWWWLRAAAAVLIGGATHVVWDAFTHRDAFGPVLVPALRQAAFWMGGRAVPWYNVLQVVSSVVGGAVVLSWLWRRLRSAQAWPRMVTAPWRQRTWLALILCAALVGAWNSTRQGLMVDSSRPTRTLIILGRVVVGAMSGFVLALTGYGLLAPRLRRGVD